MGRPLIIIKQGDEESPMDKPMHAIQIIAEIIAEDWDNEDTITISID